MRIIKTNKDDRVMIFLDLANVKYGLEDHKGLENCKIDHLELANTLVDDRTVAGAMVFDTKLYFNNNKEERDHFSDMGYRVIKGHFANDKQKEVDVSIAVEMLMHAVNDHYDVAILISGDRDFIPAIRAVQNLGKKVEVAAFKDNISDEMIDIADIFTNLSGIPMIDYYPPNDYNAREFVYPESMIEFGNDDGFRSLDNILAETENNRGAAE
jgi:uncharacterized LabA/DUF88 family protein